MRTFGHSREWLQRALAVTPGGSQTGSKAPGRAGPIDAYPLFLDRGQGAYVYDLDGHEYLDLIASLAAVSLGHAQERVVRAVETTLRQGPSLSLPTRLEALAGEQLCELTGWAEQVRWVKTGSEATEAAIRIARCATGRSNILTVSGGYHSWHSWFQAVKPQHPGVPDVMEMLINGIPYGDRDNALGLQSKTYAAVILEPAPITGGGDAEWLRWLAALARSTGTLLIFDEIVWGFRLADAGGSVIFGVTPDLATYGKAMGNGMPIAAVVGRKDVMQYANVVSGTFGGDRLGLAAASEVMRIYDEEPIIDQLWANGRLFQDRLNTLRPWTSTDEVYFHCSGYPVHPIISLQVKDTPPEVAMTFMLQRLAQNGVLWHPAGGNIMACMTKRDGELAVTAFDAMLEYLVLARKRGPLGEQIVGLPYEQAFARR